MEIGQHARQVLRRFSVIDDGEMWAQPGRRWRRVPFGPLQLCQNAAIWASLRFRFVSRGFFHRVPQDGLV